MVDLSELIDILPPGGYKEASSFYLESSEEAAMKHRNTPPGFYWKKLKTNRVVFAIKRDLRSMDAATIHADVNYELKKVAVFINQFDCVGRHLEHGGRFYWKVDLKSAFDSVTYRKVMDVLWPDIPENIYRCPELFFHKDGGLIQGASASPRIFQVFCQKTLDLYLNEFCRRNRVVYTRFADDLLFSSRELLGKGFRKRVRGIIHDTGFRVNEDKVVLADTLKIPLVHLGMNIFKGSVVVTETFLNALLNAEPGNARNGMTGWEKSVRLINRRKHQELAGFRRNK